jgi:hypothetical protein
MSADRRVLHVSARIRAIDGPLARCQWANAVGALGAALLMALLARRAISAPRPPMDWHEHLWYVWHQSESIRANGVPSFFTYNTSAVFSPHYAFYGGTLYASAGVLAIILGSATAAFNIFWITAFPMAYGGSFWLARMAGLGHWTSHVPGLLFITSPYYLTLLYRSGSWPELIAVSTIPLLLATGLSVLRDDRLRLWPTLTLAATVVLFTGSHNITLLWGFAILTAVTTAICVLVPDARHLFTRRSALRVLGVALPAALVNAWFLVPAAAYQSMTHISGLSASANLQWADQFIAPRYLLSLDRIASPPRLLVLELPVVTIGWIVAGIVVTGAAWRTGWFRLVLVLFSATALLAILMTNIGLILALPGPFRQIQFGYRLEAYVLFGVSATSIGLLRLAGRGPGARAIWRWAGLPIVALMVVQGLAQAHPNPKPTYAAGNSGGVRRYVSPGSHPGEMDYAGRRLPLLDSTSGDRVHFPVSAEDGDRAKITVDAIPGQLLGTNAMVMPPLVDVSGARIVGRDMIGNAVLEIADDVTPGAAIITIRAAHPWPVVLGRMLSVVGLLGLLANIAALASAGRRRSRERSTAAAETVLA